jgi:deoxyadenosine/deoxycytidine kinase
MLRIGVVGPCASGKTTLVAGMKKLGYEVRHIAQEHSYVPDMWKRISNPDVLIYLQVSYPLTIARRKMDWTEREYEEQIYRLRHARENADLIIDTDLLDKDQVVQKVLTYLDIHTH